MGPRRSPAKRVLWGEDEQRSERALACAPGRDLAEFARTRLRVQIPSLRSNTFFQPALKLMTVPLGRRWYEGADALGGPLRMRGNVGISPLISQLR